MLRDLIYIKHPVNVNIQKLKANLCFLGAEETEVAI